MKKRLGFLAVIFMFLLASASCGSAGKSSEAAEPEEEVVIPVYQLYLDVEFESNFMFDKYDVDVYVDDTKLGNIPHGEYFTALTEVKEGPHTVRFVHEVKDEVSGSKDIDVTGDMTFKCRIKGHSDEVEITDLDLIEGIVGNAIKSDNYIGKALDKVIAELKDLGFVNVDYKPLDEDDSIWDTSNWMIMEQNIEPGIELDKTTEIVLKCRKIQDYLNENYIGLNMVDANARAAELQQTLFFRNGVSDEFFEDASAIEESRQKLWVVQKTGKEGFSEGKVVLNVIYTGEKEMPDVKGISLTEAYEKLRQEDFSNIKEKSDDDSLIWNNDNWEVIEQSAAAGEKVRADSEIVLTCRHYEDEKAESTKSSTEEKAADDGVPREYKSALRSAETYSDFMHMSKTAIYDQLTSEYGDGFEKDAAQYAVDHLDADWNYNALKSAESYSESMHMSRAGIYDQLISEYGEQFTKDQAQYAVDNMKADWNYNALMSARSYRELFDMSKAAIYDQLISDYGEKFTKDQAQYAVDHLDD